MSDASETQEPTPETTAQAEGAGAPPETANVQHSQLPREVQHVRIGAGTGSGPRVQQYSAIAQRRHVGKAGDVSDATALLRAALTELRAKISSGQTDEALAMIDSWIGAEETTEEPQQ